jgi:hypothetical protein
MGRRLDTDRTLRCDLSTDERATIDHMKQACGVATDANLARIALWSLGDHLDLTMPSGVFDLRQHGGQNKGRRTANPHLRQHQPPRPSARPQPVTHPWRVANGALGK